MHQLEIQTGHIIGDVSWSVLGCSNITHLSSPVEDRLYVCPHGYMYYSLRVITSKSLKVIGEWKDCTWSFPKGFQVLTFAKLINVTVVSLLQSYHFFCRSNYMYI